MLSLHSNVIVLLGKKGDRRIFRGRAAKNASVPFFGILRLPGCASPMKGLWIVAVSAVLAWSQNSALVLLLIGKSYYMSGHFKKASESFQRAVEADPGNSAYHLWLGRAYGRRAETSNWFSAPSLAKQAKSCFEKAVDLDPKNTEAINDLLEYYMQAPGFLGGGEDKARALADRLKQIDIAEYHAAQARLAEHRKEYGVAELQFKRAIDLAPSKAGLIMDLARLLSRLGRYKESDQYFHHARSVAPDDPQVLFEQASAYVEARRNLEQARDLLKKYLDSPLTPDHPSRAEARKLLQQAGGG